MWLFLLAVGLIGAGIAAIIWGIGKIVGSLRG